MYITAGANFYEDMYTDATQGWRYKMRAREVQVLLSLFDSCFYYCPYTCTKPSNTDFICEPYI